MARVRLWLEPTLECCLSVSAHWHAYSLTVPILPLACSIGGNYIGAEGASALAAVLKKTQITTLG